MFNPYQFITTKKQGKPHKSGDIELFVNAFLKNKVEASQLSAWLMAVCFKGMNMRELNEYVKAIINSGNQLDFSYLNGYVVDKHSTGGVGDKVSLIAGPILAACHCYVPMIVGRSLAHTGGTLDKLESVKGYQGEISINQFKKNVKENGISIIGQNKNICPADKYIYSIRDITATIESLPLICASIISKKKAEGINGLILDIKVGNGAFMKTLNQAQKLGEALSNLGKDLSIDSKYIISDMNQPLGKNSGLWCEVKESIDFLKNETQDSRLKSVVYKICKIALKMAGIKNPENLINTSIESGKAYEIFDKMIRSHGGNIEKSFNANTPKHKLILKAKKDGYINKIDTEKLGYILLEIGGGRKTSLDKIDPTCGLRIRKKINQKAEINEPIIEIFGSNKSKIEIAKKMLDKTILICNDKLKKEDKIIYE
jgi:pyrimidine-nucleoside phosphorylase